MASGLELMDTQPLVNLVDLELPAGDLLLETLLSRVDAFFKEWIQEDAFANSGILLRWHIDNFGIGGTSHLLSKFGIRLPQQDVIERAQAPWPWFRGAFLFFDAQIWIDMDSIA